VITSPERPVAMSQQRTEAVDGLELRVVWASLT
jgi:hypothetical protein